MLKVREFYFDSEKIEVVKKGWGRLQIGRRIREILN